tara:strand:- start:491 stop:682 length:192 start_codon:yes stop_codon:yes gene_type:complete
MKYIALLLLAGCCSGKCVNVEIKAGGDVIMGEESKKCPVAPAIRKKIMDHKSKPQYNVRGEKL